MHISTKGKHSIFALLAFLFIWNICTAQFGHPIKWTADGNGYYRVHGSSIALVSIADGKEMTLVSSDKMTPPGQSSPLNIQNFSFSSDGKMLLIYTNSKKVWRYNTRGDYWIFDISVGALIRLGKSLPPNSLMFAKFSPDGSKVAYVSEHNIYVEDLESGRINQLTSDGSRMLINGTFDWVYEEEFDCRDGFRWSPDSKRIAFWQIDARNTRDYLMLNTTDSVYSHVVPVEYPVAGQSPSPFKIGVAALDGSTIKWMDIPTDPVWQSYLPRMEWANNNDELIVQHLNRRQDESQLMICNVHDGSSRTILDERDSAWIDILPEWDDDYKMGGWDWLENGKAFLWASEKDGWRHLYKVSRDGKKEMLVTPGDFDVMKIACMDEKNGFIYFIASPHNATQAYLYRTRLNGKGTAEMVTPSNQQGTHRYIISPSGKYAFHSFSNYYTKYTREWISLPEHKVLDGSDAVNEAISKADKSKSNTQFFRIKTIDGVEMDGWLVKPKDFDSTKKYPIVFHVYTEPAEQTVLDEYGIQNNELYLGDMSADGYLYASVDNRGTPAPKGRNWRKSISHQIGRLNIHDQAMAAKEILRWPFVDTSRVAVWGWSGGGSATLNLLFQYPQIYKTGIAIAAVGNELTYDNIYQERYMGQPQQSLDDFVKGSPISYAKYLKGNLLYIHGSGDDNVHFNNAEMLLNELIKYNKQFQFMEYPNRTHNISEGPGTSLHLATLFTSYLREHCPPGAR